MSDWKLYKGMRVVHCVQGDATWFDARLAHVTSSDIHRAIKERKRGTGPLADRERYKREILTELLTGVPAEHYVSAAMDFGREYERVARADYEMYTGSDVELIGYVLHPTLPRCGASPDGLIGDEGLIEIKVPNADTHLQYIIEGTVPEEYVPQMMWQMACTGRKWVDFVSYQPAERRFDENFSLFIRRLNRDGKVISEMEEKVKAFIKEVDDLCSKLQVHADAQPKREPLPGPPRAEMPDVAGWVG